MLARTVKSLVPDALKWKLRKWVWMRLNPSWQLRSGIIIRVLNYNDWMIYNDIFVDGEYDPPIEELLAGTPNGARVLDLGGNVGFFTLRVADVFLRQGRSDFEVIMVEGSPSTFAELNQRLAANEKLLQKRVRSVNGLAGERTGAAVIAEAPRTVKTVSSRPRAADSGCRLWTSKSWLAHGIASTCSNATSKAPKSFSSVTIPTSCGNRRARFSSSPRSLRHSPLPPAPG